MRINVITVSANLTGGNRVVMELINGLSKLGHHVNLVTLGKKEDLKWINLNATVIEADTTITEKIAGYIYDKSFGFRPFPEEETRLIMRALPLADINLATLSYTGFAAHRHSSGVPFHLHMHYDPFVREEGYKKKVMEEAFCLPIKKIANSTWLKNTIKEQVGDDDVGLVFPAIDHSIFFPKNEKRSIDRSQPLKIVSLAKYKWWKGFPDALRAIDIVRRRGYDIEFLAFGGAFDPGTLPEEVKHIPFRFVGSKQNETLAEFYRDADMLISASFFESFPLPPLEAMACGTPVVTTRHGTEDYAFDRENSLVVEPKRPDVIANAIIQLIEDKDLYEKISINGPKTAQMFTWENATLQLERIFNSAKSGLGIVRS